MLCPLRRTLELAPANAKAIRLAGLLARFQGCLEEALAHHRRALELDPLSTLDHGHLGLTLYAADRQAEAERAYRMALELAPQRSTARSHLALAVLAQGRSEEALAEAAKEPDERWRLTATAIIQHALGSRAESDETPACSRGNTPRSARVRSPRSTPCGERRMPPSPGWSEAHAQRDGGLTDAKTSPRFRFSTATRGGTGS